MRLCGILHGTVWDESNLKEAYAAEPNKAECAIPTVSSRILPFETVEIFHEIPLSKQLYIVRHNSLLEHVAYTCNNLFLNITNRSRP